MNNNDMTKNIEVSVRSFSNVWKQKQLFLYILHIAHLTSEIPGQCHNISQQIII